MSGVAALCTMLFLEMSRVCSTATNCLSTPSLLRNPLLSAAFDTNTSDDAVSALPKAPNIGRQCTGCGVGIEALGSPICAATIEPPLMMISGLTPKNAGDHSTRSASLPFSTDPMYFDTPCAIAGLMVYLAM